MYFTAMYSKGLLRGKLEVIVLVLCVNSVLCFFYYSTSMCIFFLIATVLLCGFSTTTTHTPSHLNHSAFVTIDGKTTYFYTVKFVQTGDTVRRVTSYFDHAKYLLRQETSLYCPQSLVLFANTIEDYRTGEFLRQTSIGKCHIVQRRERKGEDFEQKSVNAENGVVAALVAERIILGMDALERGEIVTFILALPLHDIVAEMSTIKTQNVEIGNIPCAVIKFYPSNIFFRAIMGEPSFFYIERAKPHRLIQYQGILGLPSIEGKQQRGIAIMKY